VNASRRAPRPWQPDWYVLSGLARAIRAALAPLELRGRRVLDFGCGERPYEPWFVAAGARYSGADLGGGHEVAIAADGGLGAGDASADLVASFQVLEHVWDVPRYLGEAHRVLAPGGWLLLSTHGAWLYHPHPGDYRRWTGEGLKREVEAGGFALQTMQAVAGPLAWTTVLRAVGLCYFLRRLPVVGALLAAAAACLFSFKAWLEDRLTPRAVVNDNACVYVALFRRVP
jgi:SAM-dependent methyltransferase